MFKRVQTSALYPNIATSSAADRRAAKKAGRQAVATSFMSRPDPQFIGDFARGKKLIAGYFWLGGQAVQARGRDPWTLDAPDLAFEIDAHGFTWLDDLAAVGDATARLAAQRWLAAWVAKYEDGSGIGWSPDIAARRTLRWLDHAQFLQIGKDADYTRTFIGALSQHIEFLARRWRHASEGVARFEALTSLLFAGVAMEGMEGHITPAVGALGEECLAQIDAQGGMAHRNPEELMEVFALLTRGAHLLGSVQRDVHPQHRDAIARMVPTLRALRHNDGSLARFQGGSGGAEGRLDTALGQANVKAAAREGLSMGYLRMNGGRSSVIVDGASPPGGTRAATAHASPLAFEMTSGFQPIVVACGSGTPLGRDWQRAGRKTASHSTLIVSNASSAVIQPKGNHEVLQDLPEVEITSATDEVETWFDAHHDGYEKAFGVIHTRRMALKFDGTVLTGEDKLDAETPSQKVQFGRAIASDPLAGLSYDIRFHLHPDVEPSVEDETKTIKLTLKNGEIWIFRGFGRVAVEIAPSVYLQKGRTGPRSSKQIVLSARVLDYASDVSWSFTKAQTRYARTAKAED